MRVLFVNSTRIWGGINTWTVHLVRELARSGIETRLICRRIGKSWVRARDAGADVRYVRFGGDYGPVRVLAAVRRIREFAPDVVVTNTTKDVRIYGLAAKLLRVPVVGRLGLATDLKDNLRTRFDYHHLVDGIIVPCQAVANDFPEGVLGDSVEVSVIHNGVAAPAEWPAPPPTRPPSIVYVGKMVERKGVRQQVDVYKRLLDDGYEFTAAMIGEGRLLDTLRRDTAGYPAIRWLGQQTDVDPWLSRAHIGLLYSSHEGFPNTLLEYMAHGLAIVTTPVDGIPEMLEADRQALFVEFDHSDALYAKLAQLLQDPDLRESLGRAAYDRARRDFRLGDKMAEVKDYLVSVARPMSAPSP